MRSLSLRSPPETFDPPASSVGRDNAALLFYSSGTTGRSKGVVSTHGNVIAMAASLERAWGGGDQHADEVYGCVLLMFHMLGFSSFVMGAAARLKGMLQYPDEDAGEIPVACVVKKQGSSCHLEEDELLS
uniref:4-coumarate--CoA ligase n=1 Tax=Oryza brachyantha TaxID=4533 RepID=J3MNF4_ORYBR